MRVYYVVNVCKSEWYERVTEGYVRKEKIRKRSVSFKLRAIVQATDDQFTETIVE